MRPVTRNHLAIFSSNLLMPWPVDKPSFALRRCLSRRSTIWRELPDVNASSAYLTGAHLLCLSRHYFICFFGRSKMVSNIKVPPTSGSCRGTHAGTASFPTIQHTPQSRNILNQPNNNTLRQLSVPKPPKAPAPPMSSQLTRDWIEPSSTPTIVPQLFSKLCLFQQQP